MKPRTKIEKIIDSLSTALPAMDKHIVKAYPKCLTYMGYKTKSGTECLICGNRFENSEKSKVKCSHCNTQLKIEASRKKRYDEKVYFTLSHVHKEYQVIRQFVLLLNCRVGEPASFSYHEVVQLWINSEAKVTVRAKLTTQQSYYLDSWNYASPLEIRKFHPYRHVMSSNSTKVLSVIPILKRNGYKGNLHEINIYNFFTSLIASPIFETILKSEYYNLLSMYQLEKYWPSIKICIRHQYKITDAILWKDYIDLLNYFRLDTSNKKYVCPDNLLHSHDVLMRRKERVQQKAQQEHERQRQLERTKRVESLTQKMEILTEQYVNQKRKFLDFNLEGNGLRINVLPNVEAFKAEGDYFGHCVFINEYFKREESLILTCNSRDERIATIEVNLRTLEVIQIRGHNNEIPKHYETIKTLLHSNLHKIGNRLSA